MPSDPRWQTQAGVYLFNWADEALQIRVDRIHVEKAGVYGEILIQNMAPGMPSHIHGPKGFNMTSTQAQRTLINHLETVVAMPWAGILEQFCYNVVEDHRTGVEPINIAAHTVPEKSIMQIDPILENRQPTVMFGEGDSLKSFYATFLSILVHSGKPAAGLTPEPGKALYLDYESDVDVFWERVNMITAGLGIPIPEGLLYRPMLEPLADEFPRINAIIMREGINFLVVDSAAPAVLEPTNAEAVTAYFRALRSLNVTSLTIAHLTKEAQGDYPFGSVFWRNLPRSNFAIKADRNQSDVAISLRHTKANNNRRLPALGYGFHFEEDGPLTITSEEPGKFEDLAKDLPVWKQLLEVLHQPKTVKELAEELDIPTGTISKTLRRDLGRPVSQRLFAQSIKGGYWSRLEREEG